MEVKTKLDDLEKSKIFFFKLITKLFSISTIY